MPFSGRAIHGAALIAVMLVTIIPALAADPGAPIPSSAPLSDQKVGSLLFYNKYISSATNPAIENTRISITNTHPRETAFVHLYFVDGVTCSVADSLICLTANQTASFLTSDIDPGVQGYLIAMAVESNLGLPIQFNFLMGDEYIKESTQHSDSLAAVAVAMSGPAPTLNPDGFTATINFDGVQYNQLPRVVAISSIPSQVDHTTNLILYSPTRNLVSGGGIDGRVFAIVYDDTENPYSSSFALKCYLQTPLMILMRTTPRLNNIIPQGRTGWLKMWEVGGAPLLGAVLTKGGAHGGRNLHLLTLTSTTITVPVFPPSC
jgi:hypothetical protein